jgi:transposase
MASLTDKIIRGRKYYYARECKRVNGKPKIVRTIYLGTVDTIIKNARESASGPKTKEVQIMEFGASAALLLIASRLQLVEIIDRHTPKRNQGPSVGEYMLAAVINRAVKPSSKTALAAWFESTSLPRLTGISPKQLSSQAFWNHMDKLEGDRLIKIENDLLDRLIVEFKIDFNVLLYDATNFYTYINTKTKCDLARRGHNKQKRDDLRQISLGMMTTTDFHIPLLHMVYGGNINDTTQFASVIDELVRRYRRLTESCPHITLIFDKGNNSADNFKALPKSEMHFVGSLKLNQCEDLLEIPLRKYQCLKEEKLEDVRSYRVKRKIFEEERTVLVTYNENLIAGQLQGIGTNLAKCRAELKKLKTNLHRWAAGKVRGGRKPEAKGTENKVKKILSREFMNDLIKTDIDEKNGFVYLSYEVDKAAIAKLSGTRLGKTILFTDNHQWSDEQIVLAYRAQYHIEHAFKEMKNPHFLGWDPRFHWTEQKIRVHAFYCVQALTMVSLLNRKLAEKGIHISTEKMLTELCGISETLIIRMPVKKGGKPTVEHATSKLNAMQKKLFDVLQLGKLLKN